MKRAAYAVEDALAQVWPYLFLGCLVLILCTSCRVSHIITNPETGEQELVVTGENILPGGGVVEDITGVPLEDIAGAVGDAAAGTDISGVIKDADEGDWLSVAMAIVGLGAATALGIKKRKKLRELLGSKKEDTDAT